MEPVKGRETLESAPENHLDEEHDSRLAHPMDLDAGDPALDAWLAAREFELEEMAWAMADQFGEDWRP